LGVMTGFYDAAGHPDGADSLVVCGHVSEVRKWIKFEAQWTEALKDAGIDRPFHTTDFMSCTKAFDGWRSRVDDRVNC
jgi:hypothetical protein